MKWLKHIVDSGDDPDIDDSITIFGSDGYYVFFRTLEVMGREFDIENPGVNTFSTEFLRKKYRVSWGKVVKILSFYQEKGRIFHEFFNDNRLPSIRLNCPKLQELSDEYTQKAIKKMSGQTPDQCRDKVSIEEEREEDKRKTLCVYTEDFDAFWKAYPKRSGSKAAAFTNWKKLNGQRPELAVILTAITNQIKWRENANGEFRPEWKDPERWIKNRMWEAETVTGMRGQRPRPTRLPTEQEELEELEMLRPRN